MTLRKNAREEQLLKRRALSPDCTDDANTVNTTDDNVYEPAEIVQSKFCYTLFMLIFQKGLDQFHEY